MPTFDASSMIYAWDNYPLDQFPPLWDWISSNFSSRTFSMPKVAFEEVSAKSECGAWLKVTDVEQIEMSNEILETALKIKNAVGIVSDQYHPNGVSENDLLIIATARVHGLELVSDEARQRQLPADRAKMKIPAVCDLAEVAVQCISFLDLIKRSKAKFG